MFDRIKRALSGQPNEPSASPQAPPAPSPLAPVSQWAASQGFSFSSQGSGQSFTIDGKAAGKPWRMEVGRPSRKYIQGEELRARAELGTSEDVSVMVINRPLKEALEKQAYSMYTDSLQTTADPNLPEEMRWLAMYDEVGWESMPRPFWSRYAVLTDQRDHALAWLDPALAQLMMEWPAPAPSAQMPFMVLLMRGKAYLRMEHQASDMATLQHAAHIFTSACESAVGAFSIDLPL
jgi:hypothetical protein